MQDKMRNYKSSDIPTTTQPPKSALLPLLMRGSDDISVDLMNEIFAEPEFSIDAGCRARCRCCADAGS